MIREMHTKSGRLFEADFYPVLSDGRRMPQRAPKTKPSNKAQTEYNKHQAEKKLIRLVNANFDTGDIFMHITYLSEKAPQNEKSARRDLSNYLDRVKYHRNKQLQKIKKMLKADPKNKELKAKVKKLSEPFRYICILEKQIYKSGKHIGKTNWHFHVFFTGGLNRDFLEDLWPLGIRVNADRFQPDRFGPEAAAKYVAKDPQGSKRFSCSRNLKKPKKKPKDGGITHRGVEQLARQRVDDKAYWERRYKGYRFIRCYPRQNSYNGCWYLSVVMYKTDAELPEWNTSEWITDYESA